MIDNTPNLSNNLKFFLFFNVMHDYSFDEMMIGLENEKLNIERVTLFRIMSAFAS